MEEKEVEKEETIYSVSEEMIDNILKLLEENKIKEAKIFLIEFKSFLQAMEITETQSN